MKTTCFAIGLLTASLAEAQTTTTSAPGAGTPPVLPAPTAWAVVASDANSRIWERTVYEAGPNGTATARKHRYTELCTGLNYRDPVSGQWQPSRAEIDLLPPGGSFAAAATHGQHQAWFPLDIAQGVIQLSTPDGKQLQSRPVGLFFEDDNNSVLFALLTNSVGELVGSNEVVYPNAFEGAAASLRYKYTRAGFEQDIVVQSQLPDPAALGLNAARTRLGVLTAFFDGNEPVAISGPTNPVDGMNDTTLSFGSTKMGRGRVFSIGNATPAPPSAGEAPTAWLDRAFKAAQHSPPTYKRWIQLQGRDFLMEEVPYRRVAAQLEQLPPETGRLDAGSTNLFAAASFLDGIPARLLSPATSGEPINSQAMRLSRAGGEPTRGLVVDYTTITSTDAYAFYGDTTYYVSGPFYCHALNIEGGAVIKYANFNTVPSTYIGGDPATAFVEVDQPRLTLQTSSYHPAVFTAADDDTVGETISGSTGNPIGNYYANPAIYTPGNITLSNVCIRYAAQGILIGEGNGITLLDSQVVDSGSMAVLGLGDGLGGGLTCKNCLFDGNWGGVAVYDNGSGYDYYIFDNCTLDKIYILATGTYPNYNYCNANNSIFADINYPDTTDVCYGNNNGFYLDNGQAFGSPLYSCADSPFQIAGGGNYYLNSDPNGGQMLQGVGITYDDPPLTADLQAKTTRPPDTSYTNKTTSSATTLQPRGLANTGTPDLGYHYPILDYIVSQTSLGANLTVDAGTVIGWQGQGLSFSASPVFATFNGTVNNLCYFVRCNTVQEADNSGTGTGSTGIAGSRLSPYVGASFTRFSALGDVDTFFDANSIQSWTANTPAIYNCEFWSGAIGGGVNAASFNLVNARLDRTKVTFSYLPTGSSGTLALQNCTFHGGSLAIDAGAASQVSIHDCAFDWADLTHVDASYAGDGSYNAYVTGANYLPGSSPTRNPYHDVFVTGGFNWQSGPLGNYYLPGGSPLINAGDQTANSIQVWAGYGIALTNLTTFTTDPVQQAPDTGSVDIGYHYATLVAVGGSQPDCPHGILDLNTLNPNPDVFGLPFTYTILSSPSQGTLSGTPSDLEYTATVCQTQPQNPDGFSYRISDGLLTSLPTTVNVNVIAPKPVADPPNQCQSVLTGVNTGANTPFTFKLHGSDSCNDPLTFTAVTTPAHASSFSLSPNGTVTYVPNVGYDSRNDPQGDSFKFTVSNCGKTSDPVQVDIYVVPALTVQTHCRKYHLVVDWSVPDWFATDSLIGSGVNSQFRIYRCVSTSGGCTPVYPGTPYAVVSSSTTNFVDTDVTQGQTYCYQVEFDYQDPCNPTDPNPSDPYYKSPLSSPPVCDSPSSSCAQEILITGHRQEFFGSGIVTYDFTDGNLIHSFVPDTASHGRGLAIYNGEIYYTDLSGANAIHVCSYGTEGSGGPDTRTIKNPRGDTVGIQDLAFHYDSATGKTELYVLTGYNNQPPKVYEVDPNSPNGSVTIVGPTNGISVSGPNLADGCDGFTFLPNGSFLINDDDESPIYREYSATTGLFVSGGQAIDLTPYIPPHGTDPASATGVAAAPDGSLYFISGYTDQFDIVRSTTLIQTNLATHSFREQSIGEDGIEDIDIVIP